jgi:hypothetical protein
MTGTQRLSSTRSRFVCTLSIMRKRRQLGEPLTNDYAKLADMAQREMNRAVRRDDPMQGRQAVNKAYLASVHAAREIVACSGVTFKRRTSARSTQDMGRVQTLVGERGLVDRQTQAVLRAFSKAAGQHTVCFYDGLCSMPEMADTVRFVRKALKHVPHTCAVIRRTGKAGGHASS